jgi:hypothetical protein
MKRTYYYRWRVSDGAGPSETVGHHTEDDVRRRWPHCEPEKIPNTERITQEAETFEEEAEMWANYYWSLEPEDRATVPADVIERYKLTTYPRPIRRAIP